MADNLGSLLFWGVAIPPAVLVLSYLLTRVVSFAYFRTKREHLRTFIRGEKDGF